MKKEINKDLIMAPMPVLVIGTYDENGKPNAMNAAWGMQCDTDKILISLGRHKTTENLKLKKAFTVAFATRETLTASDYFGIESGNRTDKIAKAGFHAVKAPHVDAPLIDEYPVTLECEVLEMRDDEGDYLLFGKVVGVMAEDSGLNEKGRVDIGKINLLCYDSAARAYRLVGNVVGKAFHDGKKLK